MICVIVQDVTVQAIIKKCFLTVKQRLQVQQMLQVVRFYSLRFSLRLSA